MIRKEMGLPEGRERDREKDKGECVFPEAGNMEAF